MIILLQNVTIQFRRPFWHISYNKVRQSNLLQSETDCYHKVRQVLQSVTDCYYKVRQVLQSVTDCYYKVRQVLQSATVITKWDVTQWCQFQCSTEST